MRELLDALRQIANRAGSPTMDYNPDYVIIEQRASLDWIAVRAAQAIKVVRDEKRRKGLTI